VYKQGDAVKYFILIILSVVLLSCNDSTAVDSKPKTIKDAIDDTTSVDFEGIDGWLIPEYLDVDSIRTILDSDSVSTEVSFNIRSTKLYCKNETDTCDVVVPRGFILNKIYFKKIWGSYIYPYAITNIKDCCEGDHKFEFSFDKGLDSLILDSIVWANELDTMTQIYDTVLYQKSDYFEIDPNEIVCPPLVNCYLKSEFTPNEGYVPDVFSLNKDLICDSLWWSKDFIQQIQYKLNDSSLSVFVSSTGEASPTRTYSESTSDNSIMYAYSLSGGAMLATTFNYTIVDSINQETYRLETDIYPEEIGNSSPYGYIHWTFEGQDTISYSNKQWTDEPQVTNSSYSDACPY
jgi:hypothetical protein